MMLDRCCCTRCDCDICLGVPTVSAKEEARHRANVRCEHGFLRSAGCVVVSCPHWDGIRDSDNQRMKLRGYRTTQRKREMG